MKPTFLLLFSFLISFGLSGQLAISELMYNPPESGSDSLEYIELVNVSGTSLSLSGYTFSDGVEYAFPDTVLAPDAYMVIAVDSVAYETVYGTRVLQWTSGALSNGGETVAISSSDGVVDLVNFDDNPPWPSSVEGTDGEGASIERCDLLSSGDNGGNWRASANALGVTINGAEIFGSPGLANDVVCDTSTIELPLYTIGQVSTVDAEGVADSLDIRCRVQGVVHSLNFRPNGYTFSLIDDSGDAITVFADETLLDYVTTEGDRIEVEGAIVQFAGLLEIVPSDITVLEQGVSLSAPQDVTGALDESHESQLIRILEVEMVDASEWLGDGSSFNVAFTNGSDTYSVRIDSDTELADMPAPVGTWFISGIGSQFDLESPFLEGYQLLPRSMDDLELVSSARTLLDESHARVYPMPADQIVNWTSDIAIEYLALRSGIGHTVLHLDKVGAFGGQIDVTSVRAGIYFLELGGQKGRLTKKVIIK